MDGGSVHVDGGPVHVDGGPVHVDGGPVHVDGGPVQVDGGSVHVDGASVQVDGGSVHVDGASVHLDGGSLHEIFEKKKRPKAGARSSTLAFGPLSQVVRVDMLDRLPPEFIFLGQVMLVAMLISLVLAVALIALTYRRLKRIRIPPDADFFTTLRHVPLTLAILLDLLDFGLDFFSVPIAWVLLGKVGLQSLRSVTIVEEIIPGTQFLPTMTAAWIIARLLPGK